MKTLFYTIILFTNAFTLPAFGKNNTPDYYKCYGKVSGEWNFGRAPQGCNASAFGEDSFVRNTYAPIIFEDAASRSSERARYMEELYPVIRDAAQYYIKKRKPNVSSAEIDAWTTAMLNTANQESFWSHYRISSDNALKMMRGDYGHGHGIMQVDDRYHYPAVQNGIAWNLLGNITYSMDELFTGWERAPSQSCVKSASNYVARTRAAWAAYNGGPSKICRWTNPNDPWAHNDQGFYEKLQAKAWKNYIKDPNKKASINVPCLIEKGENCSAIPEPDPTDPNLREGILYQTSAEMPCVFSAGTLYCMPEFRDSLCLNAVDEFTNSNPVSISDDILSLYPQKELDRHSACYAFDKTLYPVGKMVEAQMDIFIRKTPGGGSLGVIQRGEVAEILDFEIRGPEGKHYYKVQVDDVVGFFYAGTAQDYQSWATLSNRTSPLPSVIARPDEYIAITNKAGINLRSDPNSTYLATIPVNTKLQVIDYLIRSSENHVYYKVNYNGKVGYIYSGMLLPSDTTSNWTERLR